MSRRHAAATAAGEPTATERPFRFSLAAAFLLLAAGSIASGYFFYAGRRQSIYQASTDSLSAIINLKVKQLEDWFAERWSDARYMQGDPLLAPALVDYLRHPVPGAAREAILKWMRFMGGRHEYISLMLLDRDGRAILADKPLRSGLGSAALSLLGEARRQSGIAMSDLLTSPGSPAPHLDMAIVLPARGEPQGYVHISIDPSRFLFPLIQSWPGFSPSAETLLVRRDGDDVLYLNELRHRRKTALKLRFSLARDSLPAVQVIKGKRLAFRGRDYRGVAVWSIGRSVPGRSWFIVAKVDRSEFERPIRRAGWLSLAIVLALILGAAALTFVYWRHQRDRFRLRQLEAEASLHLQQEKFTKAFQASPDLIILTSLADGRVVEVNDALGRLTGYSHAEIIGKTTNELQLWENAQDRERYIALLREHGRVRDMETTFRVKSGEIRFALLSGAIINASDGRYIVGVIRDITDSQRAERDRQQALERLRRFIDANVIGVVIAAADGRIIETNDYYLELIGYSREEFDRGEVDWRRITPREWLPADEQAISELRQKGRCAPYEKEYLRRDGRRVPVLLADAMLPGPNEEIAAFALDLSERKRAEAALRESEGMMSFALETSRIGAWDLDLVGHSASRSQQHDRIFGYAELLPQWTYEMFLEHVVPEDRAQVDARFQAAVAAKGDWSFECRVRRADGEIRWIWAAGRHRGALGGPATRMSGIVQDISERKQAEQEVIHLNQRLRFLIEAIKELASMHTLEEVQSLVARSARRLCAADGATFVLRDGDQCHYADEDAIAPLWKGKRFPLAKCISGWVMLNKTPALIPDITSDPRIPQEAYRPTFVRSLAMLPVHVDDPFAAVGIYWKAPHAASEGEVQLLQILADAAARAVENVRLLADLDRRVQQRTAQLEASNRELEAFSYSVSHDLRAPLRAIDGFSRILAEDYAPRLDEEGKRLLGVVVANTGKMAQLIEDLLAYSRLGRTELRRGRVDMGALAREAFAEQAGAEAPRIDFTISPLPPIHGDATLLRQVWQNLLGNAVKFTSRTGRRKIEVGSRRVNGETAYFVRDNGAGFDVHYAHKLFTIFQRLHDSDEFPGTGIGLAIVQRVLQRHGGRAWAEGRKEHGATFYFTIPEPGGANG
jgi:hypothetical protein